MYAYARVLHALVNQEPSAKPLLQHNTNLAKAWNREHVNAEEPIVLVRPVCSARQHPHTSHALEVNSEIVNAPAQNALAVPASIATLLHCRISLVAVKNLEIVFVTAWTVPVCLLIIVRFRPLFMCRVVVVSLGSVLVKDWIALVYQLITASLRRRFTCLAKELKLESAVAMV
jgi:hypothetical protein